MLAALPGAAQPVSLTPGEMRGAAAASLATAQPAQALELADALLQRDPEDIEALVLRSRALRDLGRYDAAVAAGREAWGLAETDEARHAAALVIAQGLASRGNRTRAQIWLRRAVEVAPDARSEARAIRDFRYVRARNPWSTQLSFSISPTDNVNDGSVRDEISFAGFDGVVLSPTARALSGLEISGGVATRYTLSQSTTHRTRAGVSLYYETYILSDEAKEMAPDARGSDFAYGSAALTFSQEWRPEAWTGPLDLSAIYAWSWYGGEPYAQTLELTVSRTFSVSARDGLRLSFSASRFALEPDEEATDRSVSGEVGVQWLRRLESGAALTMSAAWLESESERPSLDYVRSRVSAGYTLAEPVLGARATFGLAMERRHYDTYPFQLDGRHDHELEARLNLAFPAFDMYGFLPTVQVFTSENLSTAGRYDRRESGLDIGFRSAF
jgi:tetratricopeptide (TPR) repeat protein